MSIDFLKKNLHTKKISVKIIAVIIFLFSFYCQFLLINPENTIDHLLWANEARYFETNNPEQYNMLWAYGHPGGPLIITTLLITHTTQLPYEIALTLSLVFLNALLITIIVYLIYRLSPYTYWWLIALPLLLFNDSYMYNTPPSMLAMFLTAVQFFYTLFLFKKKTIQLKHALLFGILAGFAIATRTDIGGIISLVCGLILIQKLRLRSLGILVLGTIGTFILCDPFMWVIPIQHIKDLVYKMTYHYSNFGYVPFSIKRFLAITTTACMSVILGVYLMLHKKMLVTLPKKPIVVFLLTSIGIFVLFLSSHYKAERYFFPIILVWEILFIYFIELYGHYLQGRYPSLYISRYTYTLLICYIALGFILCIKQLL